MDTERTTSIASKSLYFLGIVGIIHALTRGFLGVTWVLGSGLVDMGTAYELRGYPAWMGYLLSVVGIANLLMAGRGVERRRWVQTGGALVALGIDLVVIFFPFASTGPVASTFWPFASLFVISHGIAFCFVLRAYRALIADARQAYARRVLFERELRRRLAEPDAPAPSAAKLDTRFHGMNLMGPQDPPMGAA